MYYIRDSNKYSGNQWHYDESNMNGQFCLNENSCMNTPIVASASRTMRLLPHFQTDLHDFFNHKLISA